MPTVQEQIDDIMRREGPLNDIKEDKGGATNLGISLRYLKGVGLLRGDLDHDGDIDKDDIRLVSPPVAAQLYLEDFFLGPRINRLPELLHPLMFDMAVNHGPPRAIIMLQKTLRGLPGRFVFASGKTPFIIADGVVGPQTRVAAELAIKNHGFRTVQNALVDTRIAFYNAIVREDPTQYKFIDGWLNRAEEFRF